MTRLNVGEMARRGILLLGCAPLMLLAGCPDDGTVASAKTPATAMAPTVSPTAASATTAASTKLTVATAQTVAAQAAGQKAAAPTEVAPPPPQPPPVQLTAEDRAKVAERLAKQQQLVNQAETAYTRGVNDYRAGRLDAARNDFDSAVDLMLTSGMDLKADDQLSDEFEHLLNAVNSLELVALKQGTGFSAPVEAAPLDEAANEVTFPANPELQAKLKAELQTTKSDFPLVVNNYVAGFISYFTNSPGGHAHLLRSLERAGKYKEMISKILAEEGVPQDLIYLAVAESGFQPQALNARSGAGGMWQFMPYQGAYGLTRNGWFDERFDPEKSSRAYARYMKGLYNQFGDWYLAMAAYDWGPGYVQKAVMRTGYADFWELYRRNVLPGETKNYVPGIIAAIIMAKNPKQYGLDTMIPEPAVVSDTVSTDYSIDLRLVADLTEVPLGEIVALNPSLLRPSTPRDVPFDLHIPAGTKTVFKDRLKDIPEDKRGSWRFHIVRAGESLDEIATSLHAKPSEIATANGFAISDAPEAGDELVVPVRNAERITQPQRYTLRRGDTLVTVADRFDVSVDQLRRWNRMSSSAVAPGKVIRVAEPISLAPSARGRSRGRALKRASSRRSSDSSGSKSKASAKSSGKSSGHAPAKVASRSGQNASTKSRTRGTR